MDLRALYAEHLREITRRSQAVLAECARLGQAFDGLVLHAGRQAYYHADDREIHFQPLPHFVRFAPIGGKEHLLVVPREGSPRLIQVVERDYWYEAPRPIDHPCLDALRTTVVDSAEAAAAAAGKCAGYAYVGTDAACAARLGIASSAIEPPALMSRLDWERGVKTPYEIECLREAARRAGRGHAAVRDGARAGLSERELHVLYLDAVDALENETPYTNIIGWNEHSAILHYQSKESRRPQPARVLLIDAGASAFGYGSDVTRTYALPGAHPVFVAALDRMETLQRELVAAVRPDLDFVALHDTAQRGVARILSELGIVRVGAEECHARGIQRAFFPHGLGHHLGIQVHDVGGRQVSPAGEIAPPPSQYPFLRTTRRLQAGHVVTIETGLYFIPMLLESLRQSESAALDWALVDALVPCGGIRIEDNVAVTPSGPDDLTREQIPGH
jgi:Xaa-Pro dipeptidase